MGRRARDVSIDVGTLWTAYLWALDATGSDSRIPDIPGELWVTLVLFFSLSLSLILYWPSDEPNELDQVPSEVGGSGSFSVLRYTSFIYR